ncbi:MAG: hypothetical protein ACOYI2_04235 [Bacillota bacterium]|jgi:hypothetical protein|nr:Spo0E family sporulation regulatory protein-aspartic acid phosphatase [Clostridia bacterium]
MRTTEGKQVSIDFLETERERLCEIIEEYSFNLGRPEVLAASERMDAIVLYCCRKHQAKKKYSRANF